MTNRCTLEQLRGMTAEQAARLPVDQIAALLEDVAEAKAALKQSDDLLHAALNYRYAKRAALVREAQGKNTGTVSLDDGEFTIRADLPAKVEWDQAKLRAAEAVVRSWNEDPAQYLTAVLSVPESRFKAWPDTIKAVFAPARTVSAGRPTFKVERSKTARRTAA